MRSKRIPAEEQYRLIMESNRNIFKDKDVVKKIIYDAVAKFKAEEAGIC